MSGSDERRITRTGLKMQIVESIVHPDVYRTKNLYVGEAEPIARYSLAIRGAIGWRFRLMDDDNDEKVHDPKFRHDLKWSFIEGIVNATRDGKTVKPTRIFLSAREQGLVLEAAIYIRRRTTRSGRSGSIKPVLDNRSN